MEKTDQTTREKSPQEILNERFPTTEELARANRRWDIICAVMWILATILIYANLIVATIKGIK